MSTIQSERVEKKAKKTLKKKLATESQMVYLTFTLMYGGIVTVYTHSFIACKLHRKQSGKVPQPVL